MTIVQTKTRTHRPTPLTRVQLRELETELRRELARLERSMSANGGSDHAAANGAGARMPGSAEGGVAMALATRVHDRYQAILDALTRVAAGTYGICTRCGSSIPYGRLIALPEAARCVRCGADV